MKNFKPLLIALGIVILIHHFGDIIGTLALYLLALYVLVVLAVLVRDYIQNNKLKRLRKKYTGTYILYYSSNKRLKQHVELDLKQAFTQPYQILYKKQGTFDSELPSLLIDSIERETHHLKLPRLILVRADDLKVISFYREIDQLRNHQISSKEFKQLVAAKVDNLTKEADAAKRTI